MLCNNCMCLLCLTGGATATPSQDANITDLCRVLKKSQSAKTLDPTIYLVTYIFFLLLMSNTVCWAHTVYAYKVRPLCGPEYDNYK